jgi:hypothetical protein
MAVMLRKGMVLVTESLPSLGVGHDLQPPVAPSIEGGHLGTAIRPLLTIVVGRPVVGGAGVEQEQLSALC